MFSDKDKTMGDVQKYNICGKYNFVDCFNDKIFVTNFVKINHLVRKL
jgi:hypothetical protein